MEEGHGRELVKSHEVKNQTEDCKASVALGAKGTGEEAFSSAGNGYVRLGTVGNKGTVGALVPTSTAIRHNVEGFAGL